MRKIIDKIIEVMCTAIMGYMVLAGNHPLRAEEPLHRN